MRHTARALWFTSSAEPQQCNPSPHRMSTTEAKDPFLRILVTGGCGFLGSHLCRRLVNEGHDVIALDNFFTSQKSNVKDLLDKPNFEVIRGDVTKEFFIEVDQIYNMACPASPVHYQYNPVKTMKTSVSRHPCHCA